jgi:hypothetical protein
MRHTRRKLAPTPGPTPLCQADGCELPLTGKHQPGREPALATGAAAGLTRPPRRAAGFKLYNQRCGICPEHQKAPHVALDGALHRFCHQCGRLQPLTCFKVGRPAACGAGAPAEPARPRWSARAGLAPPRPPPASLPPGLLPSVRHATGTAPWRHTGRRARHTAGPP